MNTYATSSTPSYVTPPEKGDFATVFDFLLFRFPRIPESVWRERIERNKVHFDDGEPIELTTPHQSRRRICYYREVVNEAIIPFKEEVLFENERLLVVDKPHFLPIHPAGKYVNETLITRLRKRSGCEDLRSAHRIDRLTAGLVLCIKHEADRGAYQQLFKENTVHKSYLAVGKLPPATDQTHWHVQARMELRKEDVRMQIVPGENNSESEIDLIEQSDDLGLFRLKPITGKKHQLRVHLCHIGSGILNDPFYPIFCDEQATDDYDRPMQLLAQRLEFPDPITGELMTFESKQSLLPLL